MATTLNVAHRNAILDATGAVFNSGTVKIYTGSAPAVGDAASGTLLVTINVPSTAFASASSGSMAKNGTWSGTAAATGTPGYFRLENSGGTQRRQGTAGTSGTDMILSGLVGGEIVNGGTVTVTDYTISQPSS